MNFTPLGAFAPNMSMQLTSGTKFSAGGQVLGMIGADGNQTFLSGAPSTPQLITLPITVSGSKDQPQQQQMIQIQVVGAPTTPTSSATGAAGVPTGPKYVVPIQIQGLPQALIALTYNQPGTGEPLQFQLQPAMCQQPPSTDGDGMPLEQIVNNNSEVVDDKSTQTLIRDIKAELSEEEDINADLTQDGGDEDGEDQRNGEADGEGEDESEVHWNDYITTKQQPGTTNASQQSLPLSLCHFLKFNGTDCGIRREEDSQTEESIGQETTLNISVLPPFTQQPTATGNTKQAKTPRSRKRKQGELAKGGAQQQQQQQRVKKPRPGQVRIAKALDGTTLFCCPECYMAYPEKDALEQHLTVHKIERRFICDTCGAGLKRKEHLERHKLGHNPDRPYICHVCSKGFKRKEHLNLHSVIHSGEKTEVCGECGKGFYRKDHLRKHAKSHLTKKIKEAAHAQAQTILEQQQQQNTITAQVTIPNISDLPSMPQVSVIPLGRPLVTTIKAEVVDEEEMEPEAEGEEEGMQFEDDCDGVLSQDN